MGASARSRAYAEIASDDCARIVPDPAATECPDPDAHVFWDGEHPTSKLYAVLADELYTSVLRCEAVGHGRRGSTGDDDAVLTSVSRCLVNER
jgi:hypothetical protein